MKESKRIGVSEISYRISKAYQKALRLPLIKGATFKLKQIASKKFGLWLFRGGAVYFVHTSKMHLSVTGLGMLPGNHVPRNSFCVREFERRTGLKLKNKEQIKLVAVKA